MSSTGVYYTYMTDSEGCSLRDANDNKQVETLWTITAGGNGSSNIVIRDASGNTIQELKGIPDEFLSLNIQNGKITKSDSVAPILNNQWVSIPGTTGTFNFLIGSVHVPTLTIGGIADINFFINVRTVLTVNIYGGTASFSGGLSGDALAESIINIGYGGKYDASNHSENLPQGTTINFIAGGGTLVLNGNHKFLDFSATKITGYDPRQSIIEIINTATPVSNYIVSGHGASRTITLKGNDGRLIARYSVTLAPGVKIPSGSYHENKNFLEVKKYFLKSFSYNNIIHSRSCFLSDSMIRTPQGDVAVQDIRVGDHIITLDWESNANIVLPVISTGKKHIHVCPDLSDDKAGWPVRVMKNAISDGVPYKDMLITPGHCLFFYNCFVPVRMLVNGVSIFYDKSFHAYDYYYLETNPHSVITSDGMLTESFLNTENYFSTKKGESVVPLHYTARSREHDAAAPLCVMHSFVQPLLQYFKSRENIITDEYYIPQKPELTYDPALFLKTEEGTVIRSIRCQNQTYSFMLPPNTSAVRIISRANRPCDVIGPFINDHRLMGVAVGEISLVSAKKNLSISSHLNSTKLDG